MELVEKLPAARQNERRSAYALLGHSLLNQKSLGGLAHLWVTSKEGCPTFRGVRKVGEK